MPEEERYDGYLQLENGVGMIRLLLDEFHDGLKRRTAEKEAGKKAILGRHQRDLSGYGKTGVSLFKEDVGRNDVGIPRPADTCL